MMSFHNDLPGKWEVLFAEQIPSQSFYWIPLTGIPSVRSGFQAFKIKVGLMVVIFNKHADQTDPGSGFASHQFDPKVWGS
jgi:hypothetical protein